MIRLRLAISSRNGWTMRAKKLTTLEQLYAALREQHPLWNRLQVDPIVFEADPSLSSSEHLSLKDALLRDAATVGLSLAETLVTNRLAQGLVWEEKPDDPCRELICGSLWYQHRLYRKAGIIVGNKATLECGDTLELPKKAGKGSNKLRPWPHQKLKSALCLRYGDTLYVSSNDTLYPYPELALLDYENGQDGQGAKHTLIEGDNVDGLSILQQELANKVDVIYIDPPYNTGNTGFRYRDSYGAKGENGIHAQWLSFMQTRLQLALGLLKDTGSIFISIDDNEYAPLKLLCDNVFGHTNHAATIVWKKKNTPPNDMILGAVHEYILVYAKDIARVHFDRKHRTAEQLSKYSNPDKHPKGPWIAGDLTANVKGGRYVAHLHYPITNPRTGQIHYPGTNGNWRFNQEKVAQLISNDEIYFGKEDNGKPKLKRFLAEVKDGVAYSTIWDDVGFNADASRELQEYFDDALTFDTPKPVSLIKQLLKLSTSSMPDALVLDFFAGSGTTGEAVISLNAEDNGNRRFILMTNNENNICRSVCYPRLCAALNKYNVESSLRYQHISYKLPRQKEP